MFDHLGITEVQVVTRRSWKSIIAWKAVVIYRRTERVATQEETMMAHAGINFEWALHSRLGPVRQTTEPYSVLTLGLNSWSITVTRAFREMWNTRKAQATAR